MTAARPKTHHANQKRDRVGTYLKPVGYGYCAGYTVVADRFLGGKITRKQHGTLDKCLREAPVGRLYEKGGTFHRDVNNAVRWSRGVNGFEVGLTTRSGFGRDVQLDYAFEGPPDKKHYICGPDGARVVRRHRVHSRRAAERYCRSSDRVTNNRCRSFALVREVGDGVRLPWTADVPDCAARVVRAARGGDGG